MAEAGGGPAGLSEDLAAALADRIRRDGPMRLDDWMAACNAHYYAHGAPLGRDFTTAPEISQLFGEMLGGWTGDLWLRAGKPGARLVELGPGRGTLMADALRVLGRVPGFPAGRVELVETSAAMRAAQAATLAGVETRFHEGIDTLPADGALLVLANEFLDALPIRQHLGGGRERAVALVDGAFVAAEIEGPDGPAHERCAAAEAVMAGLARRLAAQGGAVLVVDYGAAELPADTLQAIHRGASASPFAAPGETDITAHVDFGRLAAAARAAVPEVQLFGPVPQGVFLHALGVQARADALARGGARSSALARGGARSSALARGGARADAAALAAGLVRLTAPGLMGARFKAMAMVAPGWPAPAGFDGGEWA